MADLQEGETTRNRKVKKSSELSYIYCAVVRNGEIEVDFATKKEKSTIPPRLLRDLKDEEQSFIFCMWKANVTGPVETKLRMLVSSRRCSNESAFKLLEELTTELEPGVIQERKLTKKQRKQFLPF